MKAASKIKVTFAKRIVSQYSDPITDIILDGQRVGDIEAEGVECYDGRRRVCSYIVNLYNLPNIVALDLDDREEFFVRSCQGDSKPFKGVTAKGQLAAAKRWAKAQIEKAVI
jgi:hypothetical protein